MTLEMKFKRMICLFVGHNFIVDTKQKFGTCHRCRRLYKVSYDMSYGETVPVKEIDCGEYNCAVDEKFGFVPEAGCPIHD
jgi:hypothetical protein